MRSAFLLNVNIKAGCWKICNIFNLTKYIRLLLDLSIDINQCRATGVILVKILNCIVGTIYEKLKFKITQEFDHKIAILHMKVLGINQNLYTYPGNSRSYYKKNHRTSML